MKTGKLWSEGYVRLPWWLPWCMPYATFRVPTREPVIYLTFDDGPTEGVTERVLEMLEGVGARATFFCLGMQAEALPSLVRRMEQQGHAIGNHTYAHRNGWQVSHREYLADIQRAQAILAKLLSAPPRLFRPPFGRLTPWGWSAVRRDWRCVMWDVTSQDFLESVDSRHVEETVVANARPGSIILLHDSALAAPRMLPALPRIIERLSGQGYRLEALTAAKPGRRGIDHSRPSLDG
jgi:peptidoglycan/xylan/chitin deacetylase (PgdA/CDA1 family)